MSLSPRTLVPSSSFSPRSISGLALWLDAADTSSTYTTDAGPVTAVSSPLDIAGCVGWYDSSDLSAMRQNSDGTGSVAAGDPVGYWADKSTTGAHVTGSGTARPTLSATGFNSKQALVFNGSTTNLSRANYTATNSLSGLTRIAVCANTTNTIGAVSRVFDGGSDFFLQMNGNARSYVSSAANYLGVPLGSGNNIAPAGLYADVFSNSAISFYSSGAGLTGTITGTIPATTGGGTPAIHIGSNVGANLFWNGPIAEYIIFNRALSRSELARVEAYLAARWGISGVHVPATASSDPVGYWADKSGNNRHAVQATAGSRPTISATLRNNRRVAQFSSASNQTLSADSLSSVVTGSDVPMTAIAVCLASSSASSGTILGFGNTSTDTPFFVLEKTVNDAIGARRRDDASSLVQATTAGASITSWSIASMTFAGQSATLSLNGADVVKNASFDCGTLSLTTANIGALRRTSVVTPFASNIAELLVYARAVSPSERQRLERYLAARWGIVLAPQVSNADAQDWINRVYANGGAVSAATAAAVNTLCDSLDASGVRPLMYRMGIFCGSNLNAALVPLYRGPSLGGTQYGGTTDTNNAFVGLGTDYAETGASGGLTGNGTSKYLNTGFNVNNLTATSFHLASFIRGTQNITTPRALIGALFNGVSDRYRLFLNATATPASTYSVLSELGKITNVAADRANSNAGLLLTSRTTASSLTLYDDGVSINTNPASTVEEVSATPLLVFARTGPVEYYNGIMGAYSIGAGLDATQAAAYSTAMNAFQTAMSRT